MKHLLCVVLVFVLTLSCLVACDSGTADTPTEAPTSAPTEAETNGDTTAVTEAPTAIATEAPTEITTEAPTEAPTAAPTEAPTEAETEPALSVKKTSFYNFEGKQGKPDINGSEGWNFSTEAYEMAFENDKLTVRSLNNQLVVCRLDLTADERTACTADIMDQADGIGFYIENNSNEAIGVAYFGEIIRPDMDGEHQQRYFNHFLFSDIECYLISEDGTVTKGVEYYHDSTEVMGNGLCEVPAHFKGYYVCTLTTLGHDMCSYGAWGGHSVEACGSGTYVKGSSIANIGFCLANANPETDAGYVIGDYVFVNFN